MEDKKYKILETRDYPFITHTGKLYRIIALKDFSDVKKGDLGGYIEKEENLSQTGDAWVYDNAMVLGSAVVMGNAKVRDFACVYDSAYIGDNAVVERHARVSECASVVDSARASGCSRVMGNAVIGGLSSISGQARFGGKCRAWEFSKIDGKAELTGATILFGDTHIYGDIRLHTVRCSIHDGDISRNNSIIIASGIGSRYDTTLIYKNTKGEISVSCGCFKGTLSEFKSAVRKTHGRNNFAKEYKALIAMAQRHNFNLPDE